MARSRRGGPRVPAEPAPVSLPGAGSARTDGLGVAGLAADDLQHGERQMVEGMQGPPPQPSPGGGGGAPPPQPDGDLWGPTDEPDVPVGQGMGDMVLGDDVDEFLRMLYEVAPHDDIRAMLEAREWT